MSQFTEKQLTEAMRLVTPATIELAISQAYASRGPNKGRLKARPPKARLGRACWYAVEDTTPSMGSVMGSVMFWMDADLEQLAVYELIKLMRRKR